MASTNVIPEMQTAPVAAAVEPQAVRLLVTLAPAYSDSIAGTLDGLLVRLQEAFGDEIAAGRLAVAYPSIDVRAAGLEAPFPLVPFPIANQAQTEWLQTAASFATACRVGTEVNAECVLMLGAEAETLSIEGLRGMAQAVMTGEADVAIPRYNLKQNEGLLNTALLHPLTRSVYGVDVRLPVTLDIAMSQRMLARMAAAAKRFPAASQEQSLVWPATEAAIAGFGIAEIQVGVRTLPQPAATELSAIVNLIAGSLFADIETKASFWQRTRPAIPMQRVEFADVLPIQLDEPIPMSGVAALVDGFRLAYSNLQEIWSLVLPPNSLLGLKKLSVMPLETFRMPDALWVRIVYDFVLAYRLRTINRGHLLGALTPLYLAWVASHANVARTASEAETHAQALARAFEADKPYLVSRWRWPDRFNP